MTVEFYQDRRTGKRVKRCGGNPEKDEFVLVKGADNQPYYSSMAQLIPCDAQGRPDFAASLATVVEKDEKDDPVPESIIGLPETRLNVNFASAEELTKRTPLTYRMAKRVKEYQSSLPGERFTSLDQLRNVSNRVNWDELFAQNLIFVG